MQHHHNLLCHIFTETPMELNSPDKLLLLCDMHLFVYLFVISAQIKPSVGVRSKVPLEPLQWAILLANFLLVIDREVLLHIYKFAQAKNFSAQFSGSRITTERVS